MEGYYFRIDETTEQYEIEDCSLNDIKNVLIDNDIQNFLETLCSKNPALEKVVGAGFDVDDMWKGEDFVAKEYAGKCVRVFDHAGKEVKFASLNVPYLLISTTSKIRLRGTMLSIWSNSPQASTSSLRSMTIRFYPTMVKSLRHRQKRRRKKNTIFSIKRNALTLTLIKR